MDISLHRGWERASNKCDPQKTTLLSPITNIEAHIMHSGREFNDKHLEYFVLPAELSEENYYQNSIILVMNSKNSKSKLSKMLKSSYIRINWHGMLTDYVKLGSGSFGTVWRVKNKNSGEFYAVKFMFPDHESPSYFESISNMIRERNIMAQMNECPFIIRIIAAFQQPCRKSFSIVMEYCSMSLQDFMSKFMKWNIDSYSLNFFKGSDVVTPTKDHIQKKMNVNFHDLVFLYLFELIAALSYLGDRHIVHCDIKPENMLLSTEGHIKLADLGLSRRFSPVDKNSAVILLNDFKEIGDLKHIDTEYQPFGNDAYEEPEIFYKRSLDILLFDFDLNEEFDDLPSSESDSRQTFLSDVYSTGLVIVQLLLGDVDIISSSIESEEYLEIVFPANELRPWRIALCYDEEIFQKIIVEGIKPYVQKDYYSVLDFLFSTLKPRKLRILGFRKKQNVFRYKDIKMEESVDIDVVKDIPYYSAKGINPYTTRNMNFHPNFLDVLKPKKRHGFKKPKHNNDVFRLISHKVPEFYYSSVL